MIMSGADETHATSLSTHYGCTALRYGHMYLHSFKRTARVWHVAVGVQPRVTRRPSSKGPRRARAITARPKRQGRSAKAANLMRTRSREPRRLRTAMSRTPEAATRDGRNDSGLSVSPDADPVRRDTYLMHDTSVDTRQRSLMMADSARAEARTKTIAPQPVSML